ncbi:hypothetical protein [Nocardia farcinica]
MPIAPPLLVPAPPLTPTRFGLSSAADQIIDPTARIAAGVEWEVPPCGPAKLDASTCDVPDPRTVADGIGTEIADPITVYNGFSCRAVGLTEQQIQERAEAALATEWVAVELALWGSTHLRLMRDVAAPDPNYPPTTLVLSENPVPLVAGIGMLEAHLGANYAGVGVLHAPRLLAPHAAAARQVETENGRKVTALGTRWAFGAGYPNTGPDGTAAPAGTAWIVATGAVTYRRTGITSRRSTSQREYFDPATNEVRLTAQRTYVIAWDTCVHAAVPVTLT